jgi:putative endonuclease
MKDTKHFGQLGEDYAVFFLRNKGYKIIDRNFRCKLGEIDIIAVDPSRDFEQNDTLVFVEVKTRWSKKYGKPEEAVTPKKLKKIKRVTEYFVKVKDRLPKRMRIDVVAIEVKGGRVTSAKLIRVV